MFNLEIITPNEWKELLTDLEKPNTIFKNNNNNKSELSGGGNIKNNYIYDNLLNNDIELYNIHNKINSVFRNLIYENTIKNNNKQQIGGNISNLINFYDITDIKEIKTSDIDFKSPEFKKFISTFNNTQIGGSNKIKFFLNWVLGIKYRIKKFNKFINKFEKVRLELENLLTIFESDSIIYEKRSKNKAKLIFEYFIYYRFDVLLNIIKNNEKNGFNEYEVKKHESDDLEGNNFLIFPAYQINKKKMASNFKIIDKYIKTVKIKMKSIDIKLQSNKKLMLKDFKRKKYLFGFVKGNNYFDKLKKNLETNFDQLDDLLKDRIMFLEDMEEAQNAIDIFNGLSKAKKEEVFKERQDTIDKYEKYKDYFNKITRYNDEYIEPLIKLRDTKVELFSKIQFYKKQYFGIDIKQIKPKLDEWKTIITSGYSLLITAINASNDYLKNITKFLDNVVFLINTLNSNITKPGIKDILNDFKTIKNNLNLCEKLQEQISNTGATILNKISNMEPINNIMGDLFNMNTAQAIVIDKINFIVNEINNKYTDKHNIVINIHYGGNLNNNKIKINFNKLISNKLNKY